MAPLSKLFAFPGVPIWLGPVTYACYSSTITLTSKIIKQTIDNLYYLWKDTFAPVVPRLKGQGFNATVLRRSCLLLTAVTVSMSAFKSHMQQNAQYRNLKWTFEDLLPCYYYTIKTTSKSIRSQVWQLDPAGSSVSQPKNLVGPECLILGE